MSKVLCVLDKKTGKLEELSGIDLLNGFSALKKISIKDAIEKYLKTCSVLKTEKQQKIEKLYFDKFLDFIETQKKKSIHEITSDDIDLFQSKLLKKLKPASIERRLSPFKNMFNKFIQWGYLHRNPFIGAKKLRCENNHYKPWPLKKFKEFLKSVDKDMKPVFLFLWYTGCRPSELIGLQWTDIDFDNQTIKFKSGKNAHISRYFPITKEVDKILHKLKFSSGSVFKMNGYSFSNDNLYQYTKHRLKILGFAELTVYGLRHSFATRLSDEGVNSFKIQYLMGHQNIKTTRKYVHESKNSLIKEINRVDSLHTKNAKP